MLTNGAVPACCHPDTAPSPPPAAAATAVSRYIRKWCSVARPAEAGPAKVRLKGRPQSADGRLAKAVSCGAAGRRCCCCWSVAERPAGSRSAEPGCGGSYVQLLSAADRAPARLLSHRLLKQSV